MVVKQYMGCKIWACRKEKSCRVKEKGEEFSCALAFEVDPKRLDLYSSEGEEGQSGLSKKVLSK